MTQEEKDKSIEIANTLWKSSKSTPDEINSFGFFSYSDAPGAIGGGFGSFVWFENKNETLDFISKTLPFSPPGQRDLNWPKVASETKKIVAKMRANKINDLNGIEQLNEVLKTFSQIEWIGTFDELKNGSHPYAKNIREEYRSDNGIEEDNDVSISKTYEASFREFIETYGS